MTHSHCLAVAVFLRGGSRWMIGWRYREAQSRQFAGIGLLGEPVLAGQERARAGSRKVSPRFAGALLR